MTPDGMAATATQALPGGTALNASPPLGRHPARAGTTIALPSQLASGSRFYVTISRARDTAHLVIDGAHWFAERLERATDEQLEALDATAKQAAWETVFGREHEREPHARRGIDREAHRGREREHRNERETGQDRDRKSQDRSAGCKQSGQ